MALSLRDLEYFVAIAEQKHFGKAASSVNVSQPTLSMQFAKLEKYLGVQLIERLPRGVALTALGSEVLPLAMQILRLQADIENQCKMRSNYGRLRLGVIPTISPYLLPRINRSLSRAVEGRKVSFIEAQTVDLIRQVKSGSIDIAILSTPLNERGLAEVEIFSEPFYLAVNRSNPLARHKKVNLTDLHEETLLLLGEGHCLRNQALSICNLSRSAEQTDLSATSIETLRSMVAMGAGITLMPKLAVRRGENISYIPFSESSASRTIGIIYRPSFADMKFVRLLIAILGEAARRDKMTLLLAD